MIHFSPQIKNLVVPLAAGVVAVDVPNHLLGVLSGLAVLDEVGETSVDCLARAAVDQAITVPPVLAEKLSQGLAQLCCGALGVGQLFGWWLVASLMTFLHSFNILLRFGPGHHFPVTFNMISKFSKG